MKKGTPDFTTATTIISLVILLSLLASFAPEKFTAISSDTAFSFIWSIFTPTLILFILLYYVFIRFRLYILSLLQKPSVSLFRGFYIYMLFLPGLFLITMLSFTFFKILGFNPIPQQVMYLYFETDSFYLLSLLFFLSCIVAPFTEEIVFRGVVYPALKKKFPVPASMLLSSAIFALMHNEIFVLPGLFAFGILLTYLFEKHQNLWLPISVHFFNNLFANIAVFAIKYMDIMKTLEV